MTFLLPEFLKVCFSCSYVAWSLKKHSSPDNGNWHFRFDLLSIFPTSCFQFFLTFSFFMFVSHCSRCSVFCSVAIWKTFKKFLTKRLLFHSNAIAWIPQVTLLLEYLKTYDFCFTGYFLKFFRAGLSCHCFWMFNSKAVEHWFLTEYLFRIFQKITSETPFSESIFSKVLPDVHRGIFLRHFQIGLV